MQTIFLLVFLLFSSIGYCSESLDFERFNIGFSILNATYRGAKPDFNLGANDQALRDSTEVAWAFDVKGRFFLNEKLSLFVGLGYTHRPFEGINPYPYYSVFPVYSESQRIHGYINFIYIPLIFRYQLFESFSLVFGGSHFQSLDDSFELSVYSQTELDALRSTVKSARNQIFMWELGLNWALCDKYSMTFVYQMSNREPALIFDEQFDAYGLRFEISL